MGLIILDEENDASYKSNQTPRYNARQVAYMRALKENALLVMGSATPSVETYYQAKKNTFKLFTLEERYNQLPLPKFTIVDLKQSDDFSKKYPFSQILIQRVNENLKKNHQALLFIHRRGFSNYIVCKHCGYIFNCNNCNISLTYHKTSAKLVCHYCGHSEKLPERCPKCNSINLEHYGAGTQKVEDILKQIFQDKRIERLDMDVSRKKGMLEKIINDFAHNKINILTGTQIISKGLNFPSVVLSGILFLDDILNIPDFRSSENVFNLIIQIAGRSGRDKIPGEVIIQTFLPEHYSIKYATTYAFDKFYEEELKLREELHYPPYFRLIKITFEGITLKEVITTANQINEQLRQSLMNTKDIEILGPVSAPLSKIKTKYRYQILIKALSFKNLKNVLMKLERKMGKVQIIIDVDPVSLL